MMYMLEHELFHLTFFYFKSALFWQKHKAPDLNNVNKWNIKWYYYE